MTKFEYYILVLTTVILFHSSQVSAIRKQNVRVRAAFTCGQQPARNVHALLIEADSGKAHSQLSLHNKPAP